LNNSSGEAGIEPTEVIFELISSRNALIGAVAPCDRWGFWPSIQAKTRYRVAIATFDPRAAWIAAIAEAGAGLSQS
jgi:hypothetical protein